MHTWVYCLCNNRNGSPLDSLLDNKREQQYWKRIIKTINVFGGRDGIILYSDGADIGREQIRIGSES